MGSDVLLLISVFAIILLWHFGKYRLQCWYDDQELWRRVEEDQKRCWKELAAAIILEIEVCGPEIRRRLSK